MRRTLIAAILVLAAGLSLFAGWGVGALRGLAAQREAMDAAPREQGRAEAQGLAQGLGGELERLRRDEGRRPYYEFQNLIHDPRGASQGDSVTPSSLAEGPGDPLIEIDFQIAGGKVTVPTLNEELPQLSQAARLTGDRRRQDQLQEAWERLAEAAPADPRPARVAEAQQTQALDRSAYAQNLSPNRVYLNIQRSPRAAAPSLDDSPATSKVEISTTDFRWSRVSIGGEERIVGERSVRTPDGVRVQGFVLQPAAFIAGRATPFAAQLALQCGSGLGQAPVPGLTPWRICVDTSAAEGDALARGRALSASFFRQFVLTLGLALLCGGLIVALVARTERLALQRSRFAAAAAHELRTPLAGLSLYAEMLAEGLGQLERQRDYARRITDEAARLGRVVGNVLGFTQLERRTLIVALKHGDVVPAVRAAMERQEPALRHAGLSCTVDLPDAAPARFDEDALARILQNLLDNAEKYSRGQPQREVRVAVQRAAGRVSVEVADRGPGVPRRVQRRLFRPFVRGDGTDGVAGLGLGLALAGALASAMGGQLRYQDRPGGGATFVLDLLT